MTTEIEITTRAQKDPNLLCFVEQFPLAMQAVARVHDYARGGLAKGDYRPSLLRHAFGIGEHDDHEAAVAWNALAVLELRERDRVRIGKPEKEFPNGRPEEPDLCPTRPDGRRKLTDWAPEPPGLDLSRGSY